MLIAYIQLVSTIVLYLLVMGWLLPHAFLRAGYLSPTLSARGVRRCLYNGKRCVVYERNANFRRYISRYLLCEGVGCKLLKCKVTPEVKKLKYDVVMFNRYNRVFDVLRVEENVVSSYTQLLPLPDETSYVEIKLRRVNDVTVSKTRVAAFRARNISLYSILATLMTILTGLLLTVGISYSFGAVYREDFIKNLTWGIPLIIAGTAFVSVILVLLTLHFTVKGKRKEKNEG